MIRTRPDSDPEARFRAALSTDRLDGGTLCLVVEPGGRSRDGAQRLTVDGKRRDLGLGGYPYVGLGEARAAAFSNRQLPRRGGDPTAVLQRWPVPTFRTACERVDAAATWKGYGPVDRRRALERYCGSILDRHFNQIRRADVIGILAPLMAEKQAMESKLHGWIRGSLAWGMAREHLEFNVAEGIGAALPAARKGRNTTRRCPTPRWARPWKPSQRARGARHQKAVPGSSS